MLRRNDIDIMLEVKDKNLSCIKCMNCITDWKWSRLSGYSEDILKYADSNKQNEILNKLLQ